MLGEQKSHADQARIDRIRQTVVGMYTRKPWPQTRDADEEMGWRLRMLGVKEEDFKGKRVLELGCGTGEYVLWYAAHGAKEVIGVDLSDGSLEIANRKLEESGLKNVRFVKMDILNIDRRQFPDASFDYCYSVGALHHTGDTEAAFAELCHMAKPGAVVIVSLYNAYSRAILRIKQNICKLLGGNDIDKRARIGRRLFPLTMYALNKRYHESNYEAISYDIFGFPHESLHTAGEVMRWFKRYGVSYVGAFAPLRYRDYFYAYSLPEYHTFKRTFAGFPHVQFISFLLNKMARLIVRDPSKRMERFPKPSALSMFLVQMAWFVIGTRINCFTISGRKE